MYSETLSLSEYTEEALTKLTRPADPQRNEFDFNLTEEDCAFALFRARWPDGFRCPQCKHRECYTIKTRKLPLYQCAKCDTQTSLISATVMRGTRTPLTSWFLAIQLHASPAGINALQLSKIISVTYKTAWLLAHKIRHAMSITEAKQLLTGLVKLTTVIYCRQSWGEYTLKKWHSREQSLLVGGSQSQSGWFDRIKIKICDKHALYRKKEMQNSSSFIMKNVAADARGTVTVASFQLRNRDIRLEKISNFAQRRLAVLFGGIGPKHLQVYLDQFCYAWNRMDKTVIGDLLRHCAQSKTITYRELVRGQARVASSVPDTKQAVA